MADYKDIMEYITDELSNVGSISSEKLRKHFSIGYKRAKKHLDILLNDNEIQPHPSKGYVPTPEFTGEIIQSTESDNKDSDLKYIASLEKKIQRLNDVNRRLKQKERNWNRSSNKIDSIVSGIKDNIDVINSKINLKPITIGDKNKVMIVQLSDAHFNESVRKETVKNTNEYNWKVASQRLQKYAYEIKSQLKYNRINNVIFALTGDLFNSSRRFDEAIENQDSLCVGLLTGCDLVVKFILDVTDSGRIKSNVYSVFGNESRIRDDYTAIWWEDSFDYLLHKIVEQRLNNHKNIRFEEPSLDHSMVITNVLGANILLIHGHNRTSFEKEFLKYGQQKDLDQRFIIDYMIWGHIHQTEVKPHSRRSSSLVGSNAYGYHRLGLNSYAEQNIHILTKESPNRVPIMQTITINLDFVDDYPGYDLIRDDLYRTKLNIREFPGI